jgi:two-component system, NarL family, nitrate/nitrite response regulator NarL
MLQSIRKILITDDHNLVRFGIAQLIVRLLPSATVLHAVNRIDTIQLLRAHADLGLLVVDLSLPDSHGLRVVEDALATRPLLPVVVISGSEDAELARRAINLGVLGFVPKSADAALTEQAFRLVFAGGRYLPPFAYAVSRGERISPLTLTERQLQVMRHMCEGMSNKQIANALGLTEATVKGHLTTVFRVLKVSSRSQAILAAQKLPWRD